MVVRIWNITDAPGQRAREVRIYNKRIRPGHWLDVPAQYVDIKVRKLEEEGWISIGQVPAWYNDYKSKRLAAEDINARVKALADYKKAREPKPKVEAKAPKAEPKPTPAPAPKPAVEKLEVKDSVEEPAEEVKTESQEGRKKRKSRR